MADAAVVVFSISGCTHCVAVKTALSQSNIPTQDVDVEHHPQVYDAFREWSQHPTLPLVVVSDGTFVGGRDTLLDLLQRIRTQPSASCVANLIAAARTHCPQPSAAERPPLSLLHTVKTTSANAKTLVDVVADVGGPVTWRVGTTSICELVFQLRWATETTLRIKDRGCLWWKQRQCFTRQALVEALSHSVPPAVTTDIESRRRWTERAAEQLVASGAVERRSAAADDEEVEVLSFHYDVSRDDDDGQCLNRYFASRAWRSSVAPRLHIELNTLGRAVRVSMTQWMREFTTAHSGKVRYHDMTNSIQHIRYGALITLLHEIPMEMLLQSTTAERTAFFINVYNAMVPHAFAMRGRQGPPKGMLQLYSFLHGPAYSFAGVSLTLDHIENGVLRCNRKGVGALSAPFSADDVTRRRLCVPAERVDFRIHFALNCGAKGCPPVKVYSAESLETELDKAALAFLSQSTRFDAASSTLTTTQIVDWYRSDFGTTTAEVVDSLLRFLPAEMVTAVRQATVPVKLKFSPYDWTTDADDLH